MANAKEIKERMASIEETRKITNAMYLISSSKMKQAKKKLADTEPFFYAMQAEIARILRHVPDMHSQFFDGRESIPAEERKIGYIVVTADKGLAGAYNHNVIKATEELLKKPGKHKLFVLGEAGRQYFAKREGIEMDTQFRYTVQNPTLHRSRIISSSPSSIPVRRAKSDLRSYAFSFSTISTGRFFNAAFGSSEKNSFPSTRIFFTSFP